MDINIMWITWQSFYCFQITFVWLHEIARMQWNVKIHFVKFWAIPSDPVLRRRPSYKSIASIFRYLRLWCICNTIKRDKTTVKLQFLSIRLLSSGRSERAFSFRLPPRTEDCSVPVVIPWCDLTMYCALSTHPSLSVDLSPCTGCYKLILLTLYGGPAAAVW